MTDAERRLAGRIERRVLRFVAANALLRRGSRVLLAVSGGADSLALLHIVARNRRRLGVEPIVAYIDHRLRPTEEIAAERAFVEERAHALGVEFLAGVVSPEARSTGRRGPEDVARRGRYAALAALAHGAGAESVATGHTGSDQAETVLLRLLRGSGLRGLAAMRPWSVWPMPVMDAPALVRPLLVLRREDTVAYCLALDLQPRRDPENANPRYLRNRVRHDLLPALRAINPRSEQVLTNLADEAAEWARLIDSEAAQALQLEVGETGEVEIPLDDLTGLDPVRRAAVLRTLLHAVLPDRPSPARAHLEALDRLATGTGAAAVDLPGGRQARRVGSLLRLGRSRPPSPPLVADVPVPVPGDLSLPGWRVRTRLLPQGAERRETDRWTAVVAVTVAQGLRVGPRRAGDRIALAGMTGHKRLQDLFVDEKVPREERDRRPVFRNDQGVVWVAGLRAAGWAAPTRGPAIEVTVRAVPEPPAPTAGDEGRGGKPL